jgi:hypothetical protein
VIETGTDAVLEASALTAYNQQLDWLKLSSPDISVKYFRRQIRGKSRMTFRTAFGDTGVLDWCWRENLQSASVFSVRCTSSHHKASLRPFAKRI